MTAAVGCSAVQRTGRALLPSFRAETRASRQNRSRRSHCAASAAAKDERVSRLREFFDTESMEISLIGQNRQVEAGDGEWSDIAAGLVPVERGARGEPQSEAVARARTNKISPADAQHESKAKIQGSQSPKSGMPRVAEAIKVRLGRLQLANPRETALRTLASYEVQLRERLERFAPISVSLSSRGSLLVPKVVRGLALDGKYRAPAAIGAGALLVVVRLMASAKKRRAAAVLEEKQMVIRARRGEKQRERFRQMFAGEDGVDASVFSAVRQIGENAVDGESGDAAAPRSSEDLPDDDDLYLDSSMDEEIKKAYKDFVKNSKLGEGEFWNIEDEVEAFEKIEIDFDREDDE